jgi:hypothetical protein
MYAMRQCMNGHGWQMHATCQCMNEHDARDVSMYERAWMHNEHGCMRHDVRQYVNEYGYT